jgi:hypothetical protein
MFCKLEILLFEIKKNWLILNYTNRVENIRGSVKIIPIEETTKEVRKRWYSRVMKRDDDHIVRKSLDIQEKTKGPHHMESNSRKRHKRAKS